MLLAGSFLGRCNSPRWRTRTVFESDRQYPARDHKLVARRCGRRARGHEVGESSAHTSARTIGSLPHPLRIVAHRPADDSTFPRTISIGCLAAHGNPSSAWIAQSPMNSFEASPDIDLRRECQVNRAAISDGQQPGALVLNKRPFELNLPIDDSEPRIFSLAVDTIFRVSSRVAKPYRYMIQRPPLSPRVHRHGHRGARTERGKQQVVGCWAGVCASRCWRFVAA